MQSISWYLRRLRAMTPQEVLWRFCCAARDTADRWLLPGRAARRLARLHPSDAPAPGAGLCIACEAQAPPGTGDDFRDLWRRRLIERADAIVAGRWPAFDIEVRPESFDWNRDPKHGVAAPLDYAPDIDYRDFRIVGDAKFVWESSRHPHLLVLARAYQRTGQRRYAEAVRDQILDWIEHCPFGRGMNWRSPLELAIRLINWVWAIDLTRNAEVWTSTQWRTLRESVELHLWEITRKYSRGSSANNHRIGEAAGVYIASAYFRDLPDARRWRRQAREILAQEILRQTFPDGGTREQALGYHLFVIQFFTLAALVAERLGEPFDAAYLDRLHRMYAFLAAMAEGGEMLPMFGDADDGYVVDLDAGGPAFRAWLNVGSVLFDDPQLASGGIEHAEAAWWLFGGEAVARLERACRRPAGPLHSRALPESGWYLLQQGTRGGADRISVLFDCGPLGFGSLAAHGHADALSVVVRAFGDDLLVDPGTYDYFTYPQWRAYFRSTAAHNTVVVDDRDQSQMLGPFLWGRRAEARLVEWSPDRDGGVVVGEHDGYTHLPDPVVHRRRVELAGRPATLTIEDTLIARGEHAYRQCWHLGESCTVRRLDDHRFVLELPQGRVQLELDPRLDVRLLHGSEDPPAGWVSRGYHRRVATTTLVGTCRHSGRLELRTKVAFESPGVREPALAAGATRREGWGDA